MKNGSARPRECVVCAPANAYYSIGRLHVLALHTLYILARAFYVNTHTLTHAEYIMRCILNAPHDVTYLSALSQTYIYIYIVYKSIAAHTHPWKSKDPPAATSFILCVF